MIHRIIGAALIMALSAAAAQPPNDPRAQDAVVLFSNLCGSIVAKIDAPPDDGRFKIGQVETKIAAEVVPSLNGEPLWSVSAPASNTRMLHYVTKGGICGVEVAEADPDGIDRAFRAYVHDLATRWSIGETPSRDDVKEGMRTRIWRLHSPNGDVEVGLGTFPGTEPQHILTMARAKPEMDPATLPAGRQ